MAGSDNADLLEVARQRYQELLQEVHRVIIGQDDVVQNLVSALFARGHCLLIGVPGLAKTLLVKSVAQCLSWDFKRIQFTPDLMPSDIIGAEILDTDPGAERRTLRFVKGPIFANIILADEINRTPPKTQSALLEAMQEYAVTVGGRTLPIEAPFFVVATQNPIEQEGTYPLPEAQLDRFMYALQVGYPSTEEEETIAASTTTDDQYVPKAVCTRAELLQFQRLVRQIPVSPHVVKYAVSLARATRPDATEARPIIKKYALWGAGPRASQYMLLGAKALAVLQGKPTPSANDVRQVAPLILQHRIILNYAAIADEISSADLVKDVLQGVREPAYAAG
jgi:MoxR-like ATPase